MDPFTSMRCQMRRMMDDFDRLQTWPAAGQYTSPTLLGFEGNEPSTTMTPFPSTNLTPFTDISTGLTTTMPAIFKGGITGGMPLDVVENKDNFCVKANVPGVTKQDITVSVDNNVLTISADKAESKKEEGENWMRKERWQGSTSRSFTLPESVAEDKITAEHKDGVLKLCLGKKPEYKGKMGAQTILRKGAHPIKIL